MESKKNYYNKESSIYSAKRYPEMETDYIHFFFKRRRRILFSFLQRVLNDRPDFSSLLEVGCADGVILAGIHNQLPAFRRLVGIDIAPEMIAQAKKLHPGLEFGLRSGDIEGIFDTVVEVGVLNLTDFMAEFALIKRVLRHDGYYIISVASRGSLLNRFRPEGGRFENHLSFSEYEALIAKHFVIFAEESYGLFIPKLWAFPAIARIVQPVLEAIFKHIVPELFHERIYLLQNKTNKGEA